MPYVYLLKWNITNMKYYGVRYSKYAVPDDLGVTYMSSSKYVKEYIKEHGPPDLCQVRKIFDSGNYDLDKERALNWESKVLKRILAVEREDYLNRWDNNMIPKNISGPFPFESGRVQKKLDQNLRKRYGGRGSGSKIIQKRVFETNLSRYGTHSTTNLDHVRNARKSASIEKFGFENPFSNQSKLVEIMKERYGVSNMMHDPKVRAKHLETMGNKDWSERNEKSKETNIKKYGVSNPMNRPEVRKRNSRKCPHGCRDGYLFNAGGFVIHMNKAHGWSKEEIQEYKNANKKNTD